jgi:hypothetical protein
MDQYVSYLTLEIQGQQSKARSGIPSLKYNPFSPASERFAREVQESIA